MQLIHDRLGEIFTHEFDAQPNARAFGSLYWDTIGNLEEDPFYCFVGDLIRGQVHRGQDEAEALLDVSVHPFTPNRMPSILSEVEALPRQPSNNAPGSISFRN